MSNPPSVYSNSHHKLIIIPTMTVRAIVMQLLLVGIFAATSSPAWLTSSNIKASTLIYLRSRPDPCHDHHIFQQHFVLLLQLPL